MDCASLQFLSTARSCILDPSADVGRKHSALQRGDLGYGRRARGVMSVSGCSAAEPYTQRAPFPRVLGCVLRSFLRTMVYSE